MQMHFNSSESGDELDDENLPLFFTQPRFEWTGGDTAMTRDIPLMSSADVYIDIVNIVVQSYCANNVYIYDRDGAWITLKMKQSYCELILPTLVQTVTFSSPFQGHRPCDGISGDSFYVDVIWDIRL